MKKLLVCMAALLATAGMAMGGVANLSWGPAVANVGDGSADVTVIVPLYATGDTVVDAMALGLEVQAPLAFLGISALQPGMLLGTSNDGGATYVDGQNMSFDAFNPSTSIANPALTEVPMLVGNLEVNVPAGTALGDYSISTVAYAWGDYASGMTAPGGALLEIGQAENGVISVVVPEPATALLLLGAVPFMRRRRA